MSGAVILARHGEPALSRRVRLTSKGYRDWWATYEEGGLKPGQTPPRRLLDLADAAGVLFSSTRERSRESARAISGGRPVLSEACFIEAPLPSPPLPEGLRLSPRLWGVLSRACWRLFDYHDGQESWREARARAGEAADLLIGRAASGEDVLLIAHGYFNYMIGLALMARGWRKTLDQGFSYWSARRFDPPAGLRRSGRP